MAKGICFAIKNSHLFSSDDWWVFHDFTSYLLFQWYIINHFYDLVDRLLKNILPIYNKKIVEQLTKQEFCWDLILISIGIQILMGFGGISLLRKFLWENVSNNTKAKMKIDLFTHLHNLSLRWHLSRKTGIVLSVMDRGVHSTLNTWWK